MDLVQNSLYQKDLSRVTETEPGWDKLNGARVLVSGATGMIGSTLIDVLMKQNREHGLDCHVLALGRSVEKAERRFRAYRDDPHFCFIRCDIKDREDLNRSLPEADYIFHAASNTHPVAYATDPIGTVTTNIIGLNNLLEFAADHRCRRFLFASSNEIYGENRGDPELFDESYCGYIDCNTLRAGYPESKRAGEALCQAYIRQRGLDVVIPRFTRSFGPSLLSTDTKALSQFLHKAVSGEDIVLKSAGEQYYSYTYVCDAVSGLLTCMLKGSCAEAYNIADESCDIRLKDLAGYIADYAGTKVVFEIPDEVEQAGYSTATKARLDGSKLRALGWNVQFDIKTGLEHTIEVLRQLNESGIQ